MLKCCGNGADALGTNLVFCRNVMRDLMVENARLTVESERAQGVVGAQTLSQKSAAVVAKLDFCAISITINTCQLDG